MAPKHYYKFRDVFSKASATSLPIMTMLFIYFLELGHRYSFSATKRKMIGDYINDSCYAAGIISPSTPPVWASCFIVEKKTFCPSVDFVPLQGATFTKLDTYHHSAYMKVTSGKCLLIHPLVIMNMEWYPLVRPTSSKHWLMTGQRPWRNMSTVFRLVFHNSWKTHSLSKAECVLCQLHTSYLCSSLVTSLETVSRWNLTKFLLFLHSLYLSPENLKPFWGL